MAGSRCERRYSLQPGGPDSEAGEGSAPEGSVDEQVSSFTTNLSQLGNKTATGNEAEAEAVEKNLGQLFGIARGGAGRGGRRPDISSVNGRRARQSRRQRKRKRKKYRQRDRKSRRKFLKNN